MSEDLRMYSFVNFYLSSIQQGIQSGHCVDGMSVKYLMEYTGNSSVRFIQWIKDYKTIIVLNGGDHESVVTAHDDLINCFSSLDLPYGSFEEPGLGGITTCFNAVLPESLYDVEYDEVLDVYKYDGIYQKVYSKGSQEYKLISYVKSRPLAK
jgi:hypothetical protein